MYPKSRGWAIETEIEHVGYAGDAETNGNQQRSEQEGSMNKTHPG